MDRFSARLHLISVLGPAWRALVAVLATILMGSSQGQTANSGWVVFPPIAAPGEQVWLVGRVPLRERSVVWVGGRAARLTADQPPGWHAFTVPSSTTGGPQPLSMQGPGQGTTVPLFVVPTEASGKDIVAYLRGDLRERFPTLYKERFQSLLRLCRASCPPDLTKSIAQLAELALPQFAPLSRVTGQGTTGQGTQLRLSTKLPTFRMVPNVLPLNSQAISVTQLDRVFKAPSANISFLASAQGAGLCSQLAGTLPTTNAGVPTGRAIALLNLLFWGEMGVDPTEGNHPTQAVGPIPFKGDKPQTALNEILGPMKGNGKGVTIHILDTASGAGDPFVMNKDVNYYNEIYSNRPLHGVVVGEVAQAVAPNASISLKQVCDASGNCATLDVVRQLCAVAQEARAGSKHVVNLSVGGPYPSLGVLLALNELASLGVPTAASYGNRDDCFNLALGDRCNHFPADWTKDFAVSTAPNSPTMLVSVAGWDIANKEYATYNRTAVIPWALNSLPSVQVPGEFWSGGAPYFGTSFAAPVVAGLLANWMSCKPGMPAFPLITTPGQVPIPASILNPCP